jgi:hypothetical protein
MAVVVVQVNQRRFTNVAGKEIMAGVRRRKAHVPFWHHTHDCTTAIMELLLPLVVCTDGIYPASIANAVDELIGQEQDNQYEHHGPQIYLTAYR